MRAAVPPRAAGAAREMSVWVWQVEIWRVGMWQVRMAKH